MPLCHWPCSCYPNHALSQVDDWMAEIYERWVLAHGVVLVTPVNWYHTSSALKLMIDRLVCADGGNPDPTSTHGKDAGEGQGDRAGGLALSQAPRGPRLRRGGARRRRRHRGRAARAVATGSTGWASSTPATEARLDRYIGYYEPYATSHDTLDGDSAVQEEARNVARAVARMTRALRRGELRAETDDLPRPRPK